MNGLVLFEDDRWADLQPLTFWRTVFELQVGRHLQMDRIAQRLGTAVVGVWTRDWMARVAALRCMAPVNQPLAGPTLLVNGRWVPDGPVALPDRPCVGLVEGEVAVVVCDASSNGRFNSEIMLDEPRRRKAIAGLEQVALSGRLVRYAWDVIGELPERLAGDWQPADAVIESELHARNLNGPADRLHVGMRTRIHPTAVLDSTAGSIYVSHDVQIGPCAVIEGPAYIGPGTRINAHAWLHGGNAIGPVCRVGGEVHGCVMLGYTNKHHLGFLGHAYVGSWVNIGAGTCNSDLKNTYGPVRVPHHGTMLDTHQAFFGCVIGDHAKLGIGTLIPTGAVIGFAATAATGGLLPLSVSSFGWLTAAGANEGDPARLLDVAARVMARRNVDLTDEEVELFLDLGARFRNL